MLYCRYVWIGVQGVVHYAKACTPTTPAMIIPIAATFPTPRLSEKKAQPTTAVSAVPAPLHIAYAVLIGNRLSA